MTGNKSYTTLERIGVPERLAADPDAAKGLRELTAGELAAIEADGKANGHYRRVKAAQAAAGRTTTTPTRSDRR